MIDLIHNHILKYRPYVINLNNRDSMRDSALYTAVLPSTVAKIGAAICRFLSHAVKPVKNGAAAAHRACIYSLNAPPAGPRYFSTPPVSLRRPWILPKVSQA